MIIAPLVGTWATPEH